MQKTVYSLIIFLLATLLSCTPKGDNLSVMQFNIWHEGTSVENGFEGIVDNIINVNPDMVTINEVSNHEGVDFISRIKSDLENKGYTYYGESSNRVGIISKYPIIEQQSIYPVENDHGSILKARVDVNGKTVVLYSAHLHYQHYSCYLPRGYDGSTWEKMDMPITDVDSILSQSRKSDRLKAINLFIEDSRQEIEKGNIVILGGDFNEPSHLDWTAVTKDLWDHNGAIVEWDVSKKLYANGFKDSYREFHPDVINYPGFTFPSDNADAEISKLTWAPDSDERDRIDFIYYYPSNNISLVKSSMVGPETSIVNSKRVKEDSKEDFILPTGIWPTDHKAILSTFEIR